jgi:hypothetical protein
MAGRRILKVMALLGLSALVGCQGWCNRWYPQPATACCAPAPCCCTPCAPVSSYAPAPAPAPSWNAPQPCPAGCVPAGR